MRGVICSVAIIVVIVGCAQVYTPASKNPAWCECRFHDAFGVGDQINIVAIDSVSIDTAVKEGDYLRVDPGVRRLTIAYEASKKIVGARVAASPLSLQCKIGTGHEVSGDLRKLRYRREGISPPGIERTRRVQCGRIFFDDGSANLSQPAAVISDSGRPATLSHGSFTVESRSVFHRA